MTISLPPVTCRHGHPVTAATTYEPPGDHTPVCFVCKVEHRYRQGLGNGRAYTPGPTAAALIEAWRDLGIHVRTHSMENQP